MIFSFSITVLFVLLLVPKTKSKILNFLSSLVRKETILRAEGLFWVIFLANLASLNPEVICPTAYFYFVFSAAFAIWFCSVILPLLRKKRKYFKHFVPKGAPWSYTLFLVALEVLSKRVQIFTLSFRLIINILIGHLILHLLRTDNNRRIIQVIVLILELLVCAVQAQVFVGLILIYLKD